MLERVLRIDQDVINVGGAEVIKVIKQDGVDEALKGGRSVAKAEGKNSVLVGAIARAKRGEVLYVLLKPDAIKGVADV